MCTDLKACLRGMLLGVPHHIKQSASRHLDCPEHFPCCTVTKATTVGYGRHLLAAMAPAPAMTKATTVGYGRHLLAAMAPAPGMTKATTVGYGRHLLASAPAPSSESHAFRALSMLLGVTSDAREGAVCFKVLHVSRCCIC